MWWRGAFSASRPIRYARPNAIPAETPTPWRRASGRSVMVHLARSSACGRYSTSHGPPLVAPPDRLGLGEPARSFTFPELVVDERRDRRHRLGRAVAARAQDDRRALARDEH